jgi:hypothetical protein
MKKGGFTYYWTAHSSISLAGVVYIMVLPYPQGCRSQS